MRCFITTERRWSTERAEHRAAIEALPGELADLRAELEAVRKSIPPSALRSVA